MSVGFTQDNVYLSITTPLGKDVLLLYGFHGEEALSRPFHFTLDVRSERRDLDFSQVVGKGAAISVVLSDGTERHIHGIITRFVQAGTFEDLTHYVAELRPTLWLLSLTRDSRVFHHPNQDKTVPDILRTVFREQGLTDVRLALRRSYEPREYCVQYQESAFDFVSRLMEDEGIFYFFEHTKDRHTLVLADDPDAHAPCPGAAEVKVRGVDPSIRPDDAVTDCALEQQVVPGGYAMADYFFETPSTRLRAEVSGQEPRWAQYEYPGHFTRQAVGEQRSRVRLESLEVAARTLRGQGRVRGFIPGYRFTLSEHVRGDVNGDYVLRWVSHSATREEYGNSFEAFPAATPFRPPRVTPKPVATGVQSARVVGEPGADIWTDKYGRVKVQFHWDRKGRQNDQSSCWIRVAQGQAGKGWGHFFLPHVGQEVLVTFVDGDPDRPIITGSVYNAEQRVPFELTPEQTRSTLRGAPSGEGEPNEVRFEDKKGSEELYLHARRDLKVSVDHDSVREVEHDDSLVVKKGDRRVRVEQGNEVHEVQGNYTLKVRGNLTLDVTGNIQLKAIGSVTNQAGMSLTNKAGMSLTNEAGMSLTNRAGMSLTNQAGCNLTNRAGLMIQNESMSMMSRTMAFQSLISTGPLLLKGPFMTLPL